MKHEKNKKIITYFLSGFLAFAVLGLEFGVLVISTLIDGRDLSQYGAWPTNWYGAVSHWTLTIIVWLIGAGLVAKLLFKHAPKKRETQNSTWQKVIGFTILSIVFIFGYSYLESLIRGTQFDFQLLSEYRGFQGMYDQYAWIVMSFQVLYYAVEMILVLFIIISFQYLGEQLFEIKSIPYGSIGLMLTWGMIHFVSHPAGALYITIWALVPGILYLVLHKRLFPVYVLLFFSFLI